MKQAFLPSLLCLYLVIGAHAQKPASLSRTLNIDSHGQVTIKGQRVPYKAIAGTIPVWDEEGKPLAGVFFTYFERSAVADRAASPLVISFNGGQKQRTSEIFGK